MTTILLIIYDIDCGYKQEIGALLQNPITHNFVEKYSIYCLLLTVIWLLFLSLQNNTKKNIENFTAFVSILLFAFCIICIYVLFYISRGIEDFRNELIQTGFIQI